MSNPKDLPLAERLAPIVDTSQPLRRSNLKALSGLTSGDLRLLGEAWQGISLERRQEIVRAMDEMAEENVDLDFDGVFLLCLDDPDAGVRAVAIDGLWENEGRPLLERLLAMLHDPAGEVRSAAALSLGRFAYRAELGELDGAAAEGVRAGLLAAATDPDQPLEVRRRAVEGLGYFADWPEAQAEVGRAYAHPEQMMRESAVVAMGRSMRSTWFPYIERELRSPSPAMRYEAARAVGELSDEGRPLLAALMPLVEDEDGEIAMAAIWALGQVGGEHAKRLLQRLAKSNSSARRQAAEDALEELSLSEL